MTKKPFDPEKSVKAQEQALKTGREVIAESERLLLYSDAVLQLAALIHNKGEKAKS